MIRAPISGTVMALNAQPGKEVGNDRAPVATIIDLSALQVQAQANAEQATALRRGMPVTLTFRELPGQSFNGEVHSITTAAGGPLQGDHYVAVITFKNDRGLVKPEMTAAVAVQTGSGHDVLAVPSEAVDQDQNGHPVVNVVRGGRHQAQVVEVGISDGHYTAIKSGLKEGETVEVTPSLFGNR